MVARQWKAVKPHPAATAAQPAMAVIIRLAQKIRTETGSPDISGVMESVERLLEESVDATPFIIEGSAVKRVDLTTIDFDALADLFSSGKKATANARLQASLEQRLARMVRENPTRIDYLEKLQEMIERYNSGAATLDATFEELRRLAKSLTDEEDRHVREQLTEEELAIFDLLTKPEPVLSESDEAKVKEVARELLDRLKSELLVLDWKNRQATRARVETEIKDIFDAGLPDIYDRSLFATKCALVYEHVFTAYEDATHNVYAGAA